MDVNCKSPFLTAVFLAATFPALANDDDSVAIDEIQVTTSRRALERYEVSAAVSVVDTQADAVLNVMTDALRDQPGSFLQETTPGQGAVIIRGLKGSEVLHLVDGIRMNNAIFRNAPTQYAALLDPGAVDRVEVVRGAGASLYGSGAMGGVVNFLTKRPSPGGDPFRGSINLAGNTADLLKKLSSDLEFSRENIAALAQLTWLETGNRRTGSGDRINLSGFDSKAARVAMSVQTDDDRSWFFDVQALEQPKTARVDELVPGFGETEPGSSEFFFEPNARYFAHVEYSAPNALAGANWDVDFAWQRIIDDRTTRAFESVDRRIESNRSDFFLLDIDVSRRIGTSDWVFGAEWSDDTVQSSRTITNILTNEISPTTPRFPDNSRVNQGALYANLRFAAADRHHLTLGARYNLTRVNVPATTTGPATDLSFNDISGDIGWIFDVTDTVSFVANLGRGFRAPNIFDLGTLGERPGNRFNIPNNGLDAEHVTHTDIGVTTHGDGFRFELYVFDLDYEDRIESVATGDVTLDGRVITQSRNLATSDLYGLEALAWMSISEALTLDANLTYTKGTSSLPGEPETAADRVPPLNGRLSLRFEPTDSWQASVHVRFADNQERLSPRDVSDPRIDPEGTTGWLTLAADVLLRRGNWGFRIGADNILDEHYRVHGSGVDARGRNIYAGARYQW
ncbi:MAG: TonB-dependent receptor [Woeseiaceae bacterium]|nr:TonB-dependent receptor [Woeseiaceae bacterium]